MSKNRTLLTVAPAVVALLVSVSPAFAQANSFFGGGSAKGDGTPETAAAQTTNPYADPSLPKGDFTTDEKRMQKKYIESISHAKGIVAKGEKMMNDGTKRGQDKIAKKGKILKEIGEKRLAELQANNPLSELVEAGDKKTTENTKTAQTGSLLQ